MFGRISKYIQVHKVELCILLVILLIAAFLRLYKISDYMTFLGDEGRDAIVAKDILRGDFTLLGPRASAGDFFLGPIYYYMMAPFLLLSNLDPVGPAIMIALFGIATVFLVYYAGLRFLDRRAALVAAALYAISPLVITYSRSSWNPNPMPFFSLLIVYFLYSAVKNQKSLYFILIGFLLGIAMQLHYLSVFLAVIVFVFILVGERMTEKKSLAKRYLTHYFQIFGGFLVGLSPFLAFEVRHGFPNIKTIFNFIFLDNATKSYFESSFLENIWNVFFRLFGRLLMKFPPPEQVNVTINFDLRILQVLSVILAVASIIAIFRVKNKLSVLLLITWLAVGVLLFGFYKKAIYDYYLGFLFPLPFLLVGNLVSNISQDKKYKKAALIVSSVLVIGLIAWNLSGNPLLRGGNKQKDQAKYVAEFILSKTDGKPYNFALLTRGNSDHVYRYFLEVANKAPVTIQNQAVDPERKTVTDQLIVVCEYEECQPLGNSLWEVAGFGRAEIIGSWQVPFVTIYKLVHYHRPDDYTLSRLNLDARYENSQLGFSFKYPETFSIKEERSTDPGDGKPFASLQMETPDVPIEIRQKKGFNFTEYSANTIRIYVQVYVNKKGLSLEEFIQEDFSEPGIDGKTPVIKTLRENLLPSKFPKEDTLVYEGLGGGEHPRRTYFFRNQDYIYYVTMMAGTDTGAQYTEDAENLFDEIVASIEFK